ncbi:MAG: hypothetical protein IJX14_11555 [Clostridia bacterium]|nr:hypothetical protein [Clostridia bacterium]
MKSNQYTITFNTDGGTAVAPGMTTAGQMAADILQICSRKRILLFTGDQTSVVHSSIRDNFLKQMIFHIYLTNEPPQLSLTRFA